MVETLISTIVRNDDSYLDEWIEYHSAIGFEKFVIYDHKSDVPLIPRWGDKVRVFRCDRLNPHKPDILHNFTMKTVPSKWISLLDVDEFIVLLKHKSIQELLSEFDQYGGVGINYLFYGSSKHIKRPEGLVKDNYVWRTPDSHIRNLVMKGILRCDRTKEIFNQHAGITTRPLVNQDYQVWDGKSGMNSSRSLVRINHYYTRSLQEWRTKVNMGNAEKWQVPRDINFIKELDRNCTVYDPILKK
jgi:hypothetical protein